MSICRGFNSWKRLYHQWLYSWIASQHTNNRWIQKWKLEKCWKLGPSSTISWCHHFRTYHYDCWWRSDYWIIVSANKSYIIRKFQFDFKYTCGAIQIRYPRKPDHGSKFINWLPLSWLIFGRCWILRQELRKKVKFTCYKRKIIVLSNKYLMLSPTITSLNWSNYPKYTSDTKPMI